MQPQPSNYESKMLKREKKSVRLMVEIYCRGYHETHGELCAECAEYKEYVFRYLEKCPFKEKKSACGRCLRCYPPIFEEKAMEIMGFAGPKMFLYHPILSLHHLWDARIDPDSSAKVLIF